MLPKLIKNKWKIIKIKLDALLLIRVENSIIKWRFQVKAPKTPVPTKTNQL